MLCRPKLSPLRRRIRKYTAVFLAISVLFITYTQLAVKSQFRDIIIRNMHTIAEQATVQAVEEFLSSESDSAGKPVIVEQNGGSVSAVRTDPAYINRVKTVVTKLTQDNIDRMSHDGTVSANLGSFTGLVLLTDVGPEVGFSVDTTQTVTCSFESSLESAGVNQSLHHIVMTVNVELLVYNPFRIEGTGSASSSFEIAQTVIVGAVPSYTGINRY